jgi:hypothetical protein
MENELRELLIKLERETPNNQEFGDKVRKLVWNTKKRQSESLADEQLPGQINIFGEVKK